MSDEFLKTQVTSLSDLLLPPHLHHESHSPITSASLSSFNNPGENNNQSTTGYWVKMSECDEFIGPKFKIKFIE